MIQERSKQRQFQTWIVICNRCQKSIEGQDELCNFSYDAISAILSANRALQLSIELVNSTVWHSLIARKRIIFHGRSMTTEFVLCSVFYDTKTQKSEIFEVDDKILFARQDKQPFDLKTSLIFQHCIMKRNCLQKNINF